MGRYILLIPAYTVIVGFLLPSHFAGQKIVFTRIQMHCTYLVCILGIQYIHIIMLGVYVNVVNDSSMLWHVGCRIQLHHIVLLPIHLASVVRSCCYIYCL